MFCFFGDGVMVGMFTSCVVDRGSEDYKIGICCFSAKHAALDRKTGWLRIRIMCLCGGYVYLWTVVSVS